MYNIGNKHGTQLIPNVVWKFFYWDYLKTYPNPRFVKETLKNQLQETLKELKTDISNEKHL
jgi:hypothetical protein